MRHPLLVFILLLSLKSYYVFHVVGMWEHVHRTYCCYFIVLAQDFQVACLRCRVAAYINHSVRSCIKDYLSYIRMYAGAWWIKDDDIWTTVLLYKGVSENK